MADEKQGYKYGLWIVSIFFTLAVVSLACSRIINIMNNDDPTSTNRIVTLTWIAFEVLAMAAGAGACLLVLLYIHDILMNSNSMITDLRRMALGQTKNEALLTNISENLLLSDAIKSVAFREKDRSVLQDAIRQDIHREKWDSARLLILELENRFGCRKEAQSLRGELDKHRNASQQDKIDTVIQQIESLWMIHHYNEAENEVEALSQLYPENEKVLALRGRTEIHRQKHKKGLLDRWEQAKKENDFDQGVEIIKLLDDYLTPEEGEALREAARDVFRAKLHNMGVQFKLFVTERKWRQALKVGQEIINEYPNTRMAQEVRDKLKILQERAQEDTVQS
ncbi:MAG: hypothetical protein JW860_05630 [Sedimentisphaerales bacterium]|nr:hypothetical protein [Sedimentisphaerales bacterium]